MVRLGGENRHLFSSVPTKITYFRHLFKNLPVGLGGEAELGAAVAGDSGGESRCPRLSGRGRWWGRGCRAVGAVSPELHGRAVPLRGAGAQWGGRRRSCRGPGRDGREARAARRARAREDGRRCGEGGRGAGYDGGAATEVGRAAARRETAERERETAR